MRIFNFSALGVFLPILLFSCVVGTKNQVPQASGRAFTPEKILPQGVDETISINPYTGESGYTRKGVIAATLNNVALLNKLLANSNKETALQVKEITEAIIGLIPSLRAVGIFNLFSIEEWIAAQEQPGRMMVGVLYLQQYPSEISDKARQKLKDAINHSAPPLLINEIAKLEL